MTTISSILLSSALAQLGWNWLLNYAMPRQLSAYGLSNIQPENMCITIIEAGPRVLPALSEDCH